MVWGSDTAAGFALAALLAEDGELAHVAGCVPEELLRAAHAELARARQGERSMRALLARLRPALGEAVLTLPPRMQGLLARLAPASLQKRLAQSTPPTRAEFSADEDLLAALARIARAAPARATP